MYFLSTEKVSENIMATVRWLYSCSDKATSKGGEDETRLVGGGETKIVSQCVRGELQEVQ